MLGLQSRFHFETENNNTLRRGLNHAAVPIILSPAFESSPIRRIILAYDSSAPATRAKHRLAESWPIYRPAVRIGTSTGDPQTASHLFDHRQNFLQRKESKRSPLLWIMIRGAMRSGRGISSRPISSLLEFGPYNLRKCSISGVSQTT